MRIRPAALVAVSFLAPFGEASAQRASGVAVLELALEKQPDEWVRLADASVEIRHAATGLICVPDLGQMALTQVTSDQYKALCVYSTPGDAVGVAIGAERAPTEDTALVRARRVERSYHDEGTATEKFVSERFGACQTARLNVSKPYLFVFRYISQSGLIARDGIMWRYGLTTTKLDAAEAERDVELTRELVLGIVERSGFCRDGSAERVKG